MLGSPTRLVPLAPATKTLQPGQSTSQTATWDGTTLYTLPALNGTTSWHLNHFGTFSISNPNAPKGLNAIFQITNPLTSSLTTDKQVYQLGDTVQATFTEVNTAPVPITIPSPPPRSSSSIRTERPSGWLRIRSTSESIRPF